MEICSDYGRKEKKKKRIKKGEKSRVKKIHIWNLSKKSRNFGEKKSVDMQKIMV